MKILYNPPKIIKSCFNQFLWNTNNNKILLTFDDGPNAGTTETILSFLDDNKIKSIFFCLGENVEKHNSLCDELIKQEHTIGNHTYSHKIITKISDKVFENEIVKFNNLMNDKFNYKLKYFRPPHGRFNFSTNKILKRNGLQNVMWSLLTWDYKGNFNTVKKSVSKYIKNNSIIVLHDSSKTKSIILDSLNLILEVADKKGYEIGEPNSCLK